MVYGINYLSDNNSSMTTVAGSIKEGGNKFENETQSASGIKSLCLDYWKKESDISVFPSLVAFSPDDHMQDDILDIDLDGDFDVSFPLHV